MLIFLMILQIINSILIVMVLLGLIALFNYQRFGRFVFPTVVTGVFSLVVLPLLNMKLITVLFDAPSLAQRLQFLFGGSFRITAFFAIIVVVMFTFLRYCATQEEKQDTEKMASIEAICITAYVYACLVYLGAAFTDHKLEGVGVPFTQTFSREDIINEFSFNESACGMRVFSEMTFNETNMYKYVRALYVERWVDQVKDGFEVRTAAGFSKNLRRVHFLPVFKGGDLNGITISLYTTDGGHPEHRSDFHRALTQLIPHHQSAINNCKEKEYWSNFQKQK